MTRHTQYAAGAPCWIESLQPDPAAAQRFYARLFGWRFDSPQPMPGGLPGQHVGARLNGRLVAAVAQSPEPASPAAWLTYVAVERLEHTLEAAAGAGGRVRLAPARLGADGRLAVITDPEGIALGLWQAGERHGAEVTGEPGAWTMSVLHTADPARAGAFYGAAFGWELERPGDVPIGYWRLPGHTGPARAPGLEADVVAVMAPAAPPAIPPHWAVSLSVTDVDRALEQAVELGATVLVAPTDASGVRTAAFMDPQGAALAIAAG